MVTIALAHHPCSEGCSHLKTHSTWQTCAGRPGERGAPRRPEQERRAVRGRRDMAAWEHKCLGQGLPESDPECRPSCLQDVQGKLQHSSIFRELTKLCAASSSM